MTQRFEAGRRALYQRTGDLIRVAPYGRKRKRVALGLAPVNKR
jgi:hypothetical protein